LLKKLGLRVRVDRSPERPVKVPALGRLPNPFEGAVLASSKQVDRRKLVAVEVTGPQDRVYALEWIDNDDWPHYEFAFSGSEYAGDMTTYSFEFGEPVPSELRLRLTVLENAHEERVPFEVRDVEIPERE